MSAAQLPSARLKVKLRGAVVKPKSCSFGLGAICKGAICDYGFKTINRESKTSSLRSGLDFKVKTLSAPIASCIHDPDLPQFVHFVSSLFCIHSSNLFLIEEWSVVSPPNNFPSQPGTRPATAKTIRKTQRSSLEMNTMHKSGLSGHPLHPLEKWRAAWQTGQVKRRKESEQTWKYKLHDKKIHFISPQRVQYLEATCG